jgi:predicted Zn finger-like uncharacterized protein
MSMITQCPACATLFKVVPDQLRISDGWVRCGQCDEVFDANAHLQVEHVEFVEPVQVHPQIETQPDSAQPVLPQEQDEAFAQTRIALENVEPEGAHAESTEPSAHSDGASDPDLALEQGNADPLDVAPENFERIDQPLGVSVDAIAQEHAELADPLNVVPADDLPATPRFVQSAGLARSEVDDIKLSFLRNQPKETNRSGRWGRLAWGLVGVSLTLGLMVQWLVQERDRVATSEPRLRAVVEWVCAMTGCTVGPLRQIESIAIDSSSFTKVSGDLYRLNVVLKNAASFDLAAPSLELSVTDAQDQPLVRRVLQPAELGNAHGTLAANGEWTVTRSINLKQPAGTERIAGYRLLAFYP